MRRAQAAVRIDRQGGGAVGESPPGIVALHAAGGTLDMADQVARVLFQCPVEVGQLLGATSVIAVDHGTVGEQPAVAGGQLHGAVAVGLRRRRVVQIEPTNASQGENSGVIRVEADGLREVGEGLRVLGATEANSAARQEGARVIGLPPHGFLGIGERLAIVELGGVRQGALAEDQGLAGVEAQGLVGVGNGPVEGVGPVKVPTHAGVGLGAQHVQRGIGEGALQGGIQIDDGSFPAIPPDQKASALASCFHGEGVNGNGLGEFSQGPVGVALLEGQAALGEVILSARRVPTSTYSKSEPGDDQQHGEANQGRRAEAPSDVTHGAHLSFSRSRKRRIAPLESLAKKGRHICAGESSFL